MAGQPARSVTGDDDEPGPSPSRRLAAVLLCAFGRTRLYQHRRTADFGDLRSTHAGLPPLGGTSDGSSRRAAYGARVLHWSLQAAPGVQLDRRRHLAPAYA